MSTLSYRGEKSLVEAEQRTGSLWLDWSVVLLSAWMIGGLHLGAPPLPGRGVLLALARL
jgi:hypothetical protein